jgi:hypothetical protein
MDLRTRERSLRSTEKGDWTMVNDCVDGSGLEAAADAISTELAVLGELTDVAI